MRHMAAVFSRQFDQCPFDERADVGDLPQNRLPPRHEPVFTCFYEFHVWTVLLRANKSNKKRACDNIFIAAGPLSLLPTLSRRLFSRLHRRQRCDEFIF